MVTMEDWIILETRIGRALESRFASRHEMMLICPWLDD